MSRMGEVWYEQLDDDLMLAALAYEEELKEKEARRYPVVITPEIIIKETSDDEL